MLKVVTSKIKAEIYRCSGVNFKEIKQGISNGAYAGKITDDGTVYLEDTLINELCKTKSQEPVKTEAKLEEPPVKTELDKIREQIEIEKLKKELAMVKQDNQIEPKTTLVTIDEEREAIIDDANKQAARIVEEAADTARLKAQEILNNAHSQAEVILNEAQEAIDSAEAREDNMDEREQALSKREEEHEALVEKHMAWKKRQDDMYKNEWQSRIDLELKVRESLVRTMCRDCKYNKGVK